MRIMLYKLCVLTTLKKQRQSTTPTLVTQFPTFVGPGSNSLSIILLDTPTYVREFPILIGHVRIPYHLETPSLLYKIPSYSFRQIRNARGPIMMNQVHLPHYRCCGSEVLICYLSLSPSLSMGRVPKGLFQRLVKCLKAAISNMQKL